MAESVSDNVVITADPEVVWRVITDVESYPEWQSEVTEATLLESDDQGRPVVARFHVEAGPVTAGYRLHYTYPPGEMRWELAASDELSRLDGRYLVEASETETRVTYELALELRISVPGFVRRKAAKRITSAALSGLRDRVAEVS